MKKYSFSFQLSFIFIIIVLILSFIMLFINIRMQETISEANKIEKLRIPAAKYTALLEIGVYNSLSDLSTWVLLKDEKYKLDREEVWQNQIYKSLEKLEIISPFWEESEIIKLDNIKNRINKLKEYQDKIEEISASDDAVPAKKLLVNELNPLNIKIENNTIELINIELSLKLQEERKEFLIHINKFESTLALGITYIDTFVLTQEDKYIKDFEYEWTINTRSYLKLEENFKIMNSDQKRIFKELSKQRKKFHELVLEIFKKGSGEKANLSTYLLKAKVEPIALSILSDLKELVEKEEEHLEEGFLYHEENINDLLVISWILFLSGLIFISLLGIYFIKSITSSLKESVTIARKIGEGEFLEKVELSGSVEILSLGESLEKMKNKLFEQSKKLIDESDSLSKSIIDASYDSVISISTRGIIVSCNKTTKDMFLYEPSELIGKNINMLIPSPHKEAHDSYIKKYLETQIKGKLWKGKELEAVKKDGKNFPIFLSISQAIKKGEVIFTGYIRDITEQKKYEKELQENNEALTNQNWLRTKVSEVMQLTQGATHLRDMADDVISLLSKTIEAGHGVIYLKENEEELELIGSYAFQKRKNVSGKILVGEGLVGQCAKEEKSILLTKVPSDYIQISSSIGEKEPFNISVLPILFEKKLIGVIELASFKEFTSLQEELLEQVSLSLGIIINNINNSIKTQALLEETQSQSEELLSQQEELRATNENLEEQTIQLKNSENILKAQREELKDSNELLSQKSESLEKQKEEIELARQDLEIKTNDLAIASKYKSEFLANMSHELRTPLNSYLLLSKSLLENKKGNLEKEQLEDMQIIYEGGKELLHLINDIMDLSKVEAGKLNIHIEDVDIKNVCSNIKNLFNPSAKSKNLAFNIVYEKNVPKSIKTDSQRLEQILKNFLSNSFKFTNDGSVELKVHMPNVDISFFSKKLNSKNSIAFSVIDSGIGISKDKENEIFEAFQQEDGSTSRKYGGTGLGLAISKELARILNGEIQLSSKKDEGSIFTLYLPLENVSFENEDDTLIINEGKEELKEIQKHEVFIKPLAIDNYILDDKEHIKNDDKTILIIDDDEIFSKILLNSVKSHGYKAIVANDGKNGLYLALEHNPNGIILDLGLPDMDGLKVLEQLKFHNSTKEIPVHIISGRSEDEIGIHNEAISYLLKPATKEDIDSVISKVRKNDLEQLKNALVVDNDENSQKVISEFLNNEDINTICVNNGKEAIAYILENEYSFIILDIDLPDISGFEILKSLNKKENIILPHIIIYTKQELDTKQRHELQKYSATIIKKDSKTTNKELDEALLFLQSMNTTPISNKKKVIYNSDDEMNLLKQRNILLVDDDMRNTFALSKNLQDAGLVVYEADNGQTALDKLKEHSHIELILMDIMMPVMDGYEAMREIRSMKEYKDIPIIALTAKAMPQDKMKCIEAGASDYLTKPVNFEKLTSMLKVWLFKK